jgi:hypothetical protein
MYRLSRWLLVVGVLASTVATGGVVSSGAAEVATQPAVKASCQLSGCDMKWPDEQGCFNDRIEMTREPVEWQVLDGPPPLEVYMRGNIVTYYSPGCRAGFAQFEMSIARHGDFFPQLWIQPQYGGVKWGPTPQNGFRIVSGGEVNLGPVVVRSVLIGWDKSIRPCLWSRSVWEPGDGPGPDPDYDPDPAGMHSPRQCNQWW